MMRSRAFAAVLLAALAAGCQDPVHSDKVSMLGGEQEGLRRGPLHRPGQPCTYCHGEQGPGRAVFDLAGTVFLYKTGETLGIPDVEVDLLDRYGRTVSISSNDTGNFYLQAGELGLEFPLLTRIRYFDAAGLHEQPMITPIFRARSCAECHAGEGQHSVPRIFALEGP
jgi:hypothetical protein